MPIPLNRHSLSSDFSPTSSFTVYSSMEHPDGQLQRFEYRFDRLQSSQPGFAVAGQCEALKAILMSLHPHTQLILFISSIYFQHRLGSETLTAQISQDLLAVRIVSPLTPGQGEVCIVYYKNHPLYSLKEGVSRYFSERLALYKL